MSIFPRGPVLTFVLFMFAFSSTAAAQVVINEIMQNPSAVNDSAGEWFELHNAGADPVDIDGWTIFDNDVDSHVINNGGPLVISAGGFLVLGNNDDSGTNGGVTVDYNYGGSFFLSNGSDELVLEDGSMAEVDRVEWDNGATFPDPNGASMALIDPGLDNNVGANWCEASTPYGDGDFGTPGAANDCGGGATPVINEFVANHTGSDTNEYVEIFGTPGTDYSAYTIVEIEGDSGNTGLIDDGTFAAGTTNADGLWTTAYQNNAFENGSATLLLVDGYTGMLGDDIDTDDDGAIDATFWTAIVDCVAVDDGGASDLHYCSTVLDSTLPPAGFTPGGASRIPNGTDTDSASDWVRNDFDGEGIPALEPGSPDPGEALNTPDAINELVPGETPDIVINEIMQNPSAVSDGSGEWFELYNADGAPVDIDGWTIADNDSDSHMINNGGPLVIPAGGFLVLGNNADSGTNGGVNVQYDYGSSFFLANGSDELVLLDGTATEVDRVEWDNGATFPDPAGASMALIDPSFDNNVGGNWCEATTPYGDGDSGTPGSVNDCEGSPIQILINEVDADTAGTDTMEFVELFDGGSGNTALDGMVVVLFNGSDDASYAAFDLDGQSTGVDGYFTMCNAGVSGCGITFPDNTVQNGADAVALYTGDAADFPGDTPVTATNLIDAIVYDTNDSDDSGLIDVLTPGQPQINEGGAGDKDAHSNQRCPNGSGGPFGTSSYEQWTPTPGAENVCAEVVGPPMCGDTENATLISAVQGTTDVSPLEGMEVEIEGVVVGEFQGPDELGGLFVQEEDADADGDPLTSEGIFVFTNVAANVGDQVRARGTVDEFFGLTEIAPVSDLVVCAKGVTPPSPVAVTMPMTSPDEFEAYESMAVTFAQPLVINANFNLFRFGEMTVSSTRLFTPTAVVAPGGPANTLADANALDMLILDDRRTGSYLLPPVTGQDDTNPLAADNTVRSGHTVNGLAGVMHYAFGAYRVQPTGPFTIDESANPRPASPDAVGGTLKVAGFNVLNFFTTLDTGAPICGPAANQGCRGANDLNEYNRQLDKLVSAIVGIDADVLGLVELENNASASLQAIVDAVNAVMGAGTYAYVDTGTIGGDVIKQGLIYKPASVTPEGDYAILTSTVDPRFNDSLNRPSLAQSFRATDNLALFTTIVNHLKSKGCGGASGDDEDQGDGQGCYNATRTSAAEALGDWANADPTGTGADSVLIVGDLNSYFMEDPIEALITAGFTSLEFAFNGPGSYSYTFSAQAGSLDYAMSSPALTPKITGAVPWNINADEPTALDYNTENGRPANFYAPDPFRTSDHDPIVVGMELNPPSSLTIPTTAAGVDAFIEISGAGDKCGFSAAEFIDPNTVSPPPPANLVFPYGVLQFTAEGCNEGATATIEVTLPAIPDLLALFKFTPAGGWMPYQFQLNGNTFSYQVIDGGTGDADSTQNGVFVDPAGPAVVAGGEERATFLVTKDFDDDNPAEVEVTLSCNTGLPLEQNAMIAESEHVEFVVGDFEVGSMDCSVSETVPEGYAPDHAAGIGFAGVAGEVISGEAACSYVGVANGQFTCAITNTLQAVDITVFKEWVDEHPEYELPEIVEIELSCSGIGFVGAQFIAPGSPGEFSVLPHYEGTACTVTEEPQVGVLTDLQDCDGLTVEPGHGAECTIVNTRLFAGIPTLSQYGLLILSLLMMMVGAVAVRRLA